MSRLGGISDKVRTFGVGLRTSYELMAPRERMMAVGLVLVVECVLLGVLTMFLLGFKADAASRSDVSSRRLDEVNALAASYETLTARVAAAETRMDQFKPSQMNTYVEGWATSAGVLPYLREVRETGNEVADDYLQRAYQIELSGAPFDGVLKFMYAMETAPFPLRIRKAKMAADTNRDSNMRMMRVNLEVVTYARAGSQP